MNLIETLAAGPSRTGLESLQPRDMNSKTWTDKVLAEQLRLLYHNAPTPVMVSVFVSAVICWALWDISDRTILTGWFVAIFITASVRIFLTLAFEHSSNARQRIGLWHTLFLVGTYISALLWGLSAFLIFPYDSPIHQSLFTIVISGLSAAAVASLCPSWLATSGFLGLTLAPLAARFIILGDDYSNVLGAMVVLFLFTTLFGAKRIHDNIRENINLRLQSGERERILKASEERYRHIFSNAPLGVFHYDNVSRIIDCNAVFADIVGTDARTLLGTNLISSVAENKISAAIELSLRTGEGYFEGDYVSSNTRKTSPVRAFFRAIRSTDNSIIGGVGIVEDLTERKQSEAQIRYQASYDQLTGLPNRRLLSEHLGRELARAIRHNRYGALLFFDLDNFKTINESLGHSVGDELLKLVADRIATTLRQEDSVARMGGDEFVVLLPDLDEQLEVAAKGAQRLAEKLIESLRMPFFVAEHELHVTSSIGISLFPAEDQIVDDILKQADTAMYRAKAAGRNTLRFFLPGMQQAADSRLRLDTELRKALSNNELSIHYQPQVGIDGEIYGAEALVRWFHPERGRICPGEFIPVAEETGMIRNIGHWVLRNVCKRIKAWTDTGLLAQNQAIAVNISPKEFTSRGFVDQVTAILRETGANPEQLDLELTESSLLVNVPDAVERINTLRTLGIKFSIDDFGTGYSSLSYLKKLPLNKLKIDHSFVKDITSNSGDAAIVETIIMMAYNLGLDVIAEGVETEQELAFLHARGCTVYQGFYFSRALPEDDFLELLETSVLSTSSIRPISDKETMRQESA